MGIEPTSEAWECLITQRGERLTLARSQRVNEASSIAPAARPKTACVASSSVAVKR